MIVSPRGGRRRSLKQVGRLTARPTGGRFLPLAVVETGGAGR